MTSINGALYNAEAYNGNGAGSAALTRSLSDTAGPTDVLAATSAHPCSLNDTTGPTDSLASGGHGSAALSDTAGPTDSLARAGAHPRTLADVIGPSDSLVDTSGSRPRSLADTAGPTDLLTPVAHRTRPLADTAGPTDLLFVPGSTRTVGLTLNGTTTVTSTDAQFTVLDEGNTIVAAGIPAGATILAIVNATTAVISIAATVTASGVTGWISPPGPLGWTIEVWDKGANRWLATLNKAQFVAPTQDRRNQVGTFKFRLGQYDPNAPTCNPKLGREVKVFRAGVLRWAGRIWTDNVDFHNASVEFGCFSLLDYLRDRNIDRGANRINLLSNSDFEAGLTGWTAVATTATSITSDKKMGSKAVQLVQGSDDADAYLGQQVTYTAVDTLGDEVTLVAWFKIASWTGPALANYGLVIRVTDMSGNVVVPGGFASSDVNYQIVRGGWLKASTIGFVPYGTPYHVEARLYSPNGTIRWDASFMTVFESLSLLQTEQSHMLTAVAAFLQDPTKGKDNLNINTNCPDTGVTRDRTWQFADHISGQQAVTEFTHLADGMDIEITPQRVLKSYYIPSGGIGTDKTSWVTLTFGANCEPARSAFDGPQGGSDVTSLGDGSGPGREEGGAVNAALYGGVTVQQIVPCPAPDTPIDILGPYATRELAEFADPTSIDIVVTDRALGWTLAMGDRVLLSANLGYVQEPSTVARISALSSDPVTDLVTATVNRLS